ncbi:MAG: class I SAM-dependent methyltransferase [Planctomycetota bacterium]|jgi:hypothetical protein
MASLLRALRNAARGQRPGRFLRLAGYGLSELYNDWRLGISTLGYIDRKELGYGSRECHFYAPTAYRDLKKALRLVPIRPGRDVFLDYGSGMGRVIVTAATYPFRAVIGVELSEQLNRVARKNLERARRKLMCRDVRIVCADAAAYAVPGDVTVVYLYNPFEGRLLTKVLENLRRSLEAAQRRLYLIFKNPVHLDKLCGVIPWLSARDQFKCVTGHRCVIYESTIPAGGHGN